MKLCGFEVGLDQPVFLIAGPCVIESRELAMDTAGELKAICSAVGISFIYDKVKIISNFRISIFIFFSRNLWSFILLRVMNRFSIFCCDWPVCYLACSSCLTVFILPYFMFGIKINGIYNRNKLFLYCLLVNKCSHC